WLPRALPGRDEVNERYLPSGLQRGEFSLSELKVICRSLLPSMFTIQMCEFDLSSLVSVVPTTYATHWPSGEICGSLTLRKRVRSSSFIGRRAVCAARELASARMSSREIEDRRRRSIGASRNVVLRAYSAETEVSHAKTQRRKESRKGNSILFAFLCAFASLREKTSSEAYAALKTYLLSSGGMASFCPTLIMSGSFSWSRFA